MMKLLNNILNIEYILPFIAIGLWLVLLICCIRKRQFRTIIVDSGATRVLWLLSFLIFNPILILLYLIFGQFSRPRFGESTRPVLLSIILILAAMGFTNNIISSNLSYHYLRNWGKDVPDDSDGVFHFEATLASIASNNNTSTSSSSATFGDFQAFSCRNIVIINTNGTNFNRRICEILVEDLKANININSVSVISPDSTNTQPSAVPDIIFKISSNINNKIELPGEKNLDARISISSSTGDGPLFSRCRYNTEDDYTDGLSFNWNMTLNHSSKTTGYETVSFTLAIKDIAKNISKTITKMIEDNLEKYSSQPEFSDYIREYQNYPLPDCIAANNPQILFTGSSNFISNLTYFRFYNDRPSAELLAEYIAIFENDGWKIWRDDKNGSEHNAPKGKEKELAFFSATKDNISIQLARPMNKNDTGYEYHTQMKSSDTSGWTRSELKVDIPDQDFIYGRFRCSVTPEQRTELIDRLLKDTSINQSDLFSLVDYFNDKQKNKFLNMTENNNTYGYKQLIWQADMLVKNQRIEDAVYRLKAGQVQALIEGEYDKLKSSAKHIAEKANYVIEDKYFPTKADIEQLGYPRLSEIMIPIEQEILPGESFTAYYTNEEDFVFQMFKTYRNNDTPPLLDDINKKIRRNGSSTSSKKGISLDTPYSCTVFINNVTPIYLNVSYDSQTGKITIATRSN